jgi:hypothetical protein
MQKELWNFNTIPIRSSNRASGAKQFPSQETQEKCALLKEKMVVFRFALHRNLCAIDPAISKIWN